MKKLLLLLAVLSCSNAVTETRDRTRALAGANADTVVRELGAPSASYRMPQSQHTVYVYEAQRVHRGSVAGAALSGMGSGMTGQPSTARPRTTGCRFELEFGDDGRLLHTSEHGEGC